MWGLLLTLPIERVLTADVAGFTVRPVYLFMALLAVLNARKIPRSGIAGVVGAGIAVAIGASSVQSLDPRQTVGYSAWGIFTILFFVAMVGRLRERRGPRRELDEDLRSHSGHVGRLHPVPFASVVQP